MCELDLRFVGAIEESDWYNVLHANTASTKPNSRNSHPSLCDGRKKTLSKQAGKWRGPFWTKRIDFSMYRVKVCSG